MVKIYYRDLDAFSNICPTPLVGLSNSASRGGGFLGESENITLEGTITGCQGFSGIYSKYLTMIQRFSKNFGDLSIVENPSDSHISATSSAVLIGGSVSTLQVSDSSIFNSSTNVLVGGISGIPNGIYGIDSLPSSTGISIAYTGVANYVPNQDGFIIAVESDSSLIYSKKVVVDNFSIPDNKFFGIIPFSAEFRRFDSVGEFFNYGVEDADEEFSFSDNNDCSYSIEHTISAKGTFDSPNFSPIANAKAYCLSKTGWNSVITPEFIPEPSEVALISIQESINRAAGEVSITENYLFSDELNTSGYPAVMRYTVDGQENEEELLVSIDGSLNYDLNQPIASMREVISSQDWFSIASGHANLFNSTLVNREISRSVKESHKSREISFSFRYSDSIKNTGDVKYSEWITIDEPANSEPCITVRGRIEKNKYYCHGDAWAATLAYYSGLDPYSIALDAWNSEGFTGVMSSHYNNRSYSQNKNQGLIEFSQTFCGKKFGEDECLRDVNYSLNFSPSITKYSAEPLLSGDGEYVIQNLGYKNRGRYSVNGSASISDCCSQQQGKNKARAMLDELSNMFFVGTDKILDSQTITVTEDGKTVNFQAQWSMNSGISTPAELL